MIHLSSIPETVPFSIALLMVALTFVGTLMIAKGWWG
jgi:hypothetical protein